MRIFGGRRLLFSALLLANHAHGQPAVAVGCVADLDALAPYVIANDAGAHDRVEREGQEVFDAAREMARKRAAASTDDDSCLVALRGFLHAVRQSHLLIRGASPSAKPSPAAPAEPSFRALSRTTALIVIPSFEDGAAGAIAALLKTHAKDILQLPNLVVDVRGNGGGADWAYAPLLRLAEANIRREVGDELWATPANAAASRDACQAFRMYSDECREFIRRESEAMSHAPARSFIPQPGEPPLKLIEPKETLPRPRRIAVLVDGRCASSCESFLLAMRQSYKVKLFGQQSAGAIDYGNLRPWTLPSGKRQLFYAVSRSLRLPGVSLDGVGILPEQLLPTATNAVARERQLAEVQRVVESVRP